MKGLFTHTLQILMVKMKIVLTYTLKMNTETSHQPIASLQVQISLPVHTQNCSHPIVILQILTGVMKMKIKKLDFILSVLIQFYPF